MRTRRPVFFQHMTTLEKKKKKSQLVPQLKWLETILFKRNKGLCLNNMCLYRGNAIGQVVLAGDTQQFILWQLKATEGTWSSFLLHLWCVWTSVDQDPNAAYVKEGEEAWSRQRMEWSTYVWRRGREKNPKRNCACSVDLPNHSLDLLPVCRVDLVTVLRSHQHGSKAKGWVLQSGTVTLDNCWC